MKNTQTKKIPLFACQECGKKFYTAESANRAAFGDNGCPKCGGSDIDMWLPITNHSLPVIKQTFNYLD